MVGDRLLRQEQPLGDRRVAQPGSDQIEDLSLAGVSSGNGSDCWAGVTGPLKWLITRTATPGLKIASPAATARIARSISCCSAPLSR